MPLGLGSAKPTLFFRSAMATSSKNAEEETAETQPVVVATGDVGKAEQTGGKQGSGHAVKEHASDDGEEAEKPETTFSIDDKIIFSGLVSEAGKKLNGTRGVVKCELNERGRYKCFSEKLNDFTDIKPERLTLATSSAWRAAGEAHLKEKDLKEKAAGEKKEVKKSGAPVWVKVSATHPLFVFEPSNATLSRAEKGHWHYNYDAGGCTWQEFIEEEILKPENYLPDVHKQRIERDKNGRFTNVTVFDHTVGDEYSLDTKLCDLSVAFHDAQYTVRIN